MADRPAFFAPSHILSYGTLLGLQTYQTFVGGIIAFRALPRPQFSTLQASVFPVYFGLQTVLPLVVAATYPGERTAQGVAASGIAGMLSEEHRFTTFLPLFTAFVSGVTNLMLVGPATTRKMRQRKQQETVDGKKSYDPAPHSNKMMQLNKSFRRLHGLSSLLNLASFAATAYYGIVLSRRLD